MSSKVKCPICENSFSLINTTHLKKHGLTVSQFKELYPNSSICSKDFRDKMQVINTEINSREDVRKTLSRKIKEVNRDKIFLKNKSEKMKAVWGYNEYKEKMRIIHLKTQNRLGIQEKKSNSLKSRWKTQEFRDKMKLVYNTPEYKEKVRRIQQEVSSRPTIIQNKSDKSKELWKDRDYRIKNARGHSKKPYITLEGKEIFLRSSWEYLVCKYLDTLKYEFVYEGFDFKYTIENKEHVYIPDFYIRELDLFLEVKPNIFMCDSVNKIKLDCVLHQGRRIKHIGEDTLQDINTFKDCIEESSSTIPRT
jgi:hypothetical protein